MDAPRQSAQMSPRGVWLQVGFGEGEESLEEEKAVSGCTVVSGTWKKVWGLQEDGEPAPLGVSPESWPNIISQELASSVPEVRRALLAFGHF